MRQTETLQRKRFQAFRQLNSPDKIIGITKEKNWTSTKFLAQNFFFVNSLLKEKNNNNNEGYQH